MVNSPLSGHYPTLKNDWGWLPALKSANSQFIKIQKGRKKNDLHAY